MNSYRPRLLGHHTDRLLQILEEAVNSALDLPQAHILGGGQDALHIGPGERTLTRERELDGDALERRVELVQMKAGAGGALEIGLPVVLVAEERTQYVPIEDVRAGIRSPHVVGHEHEVREQGITQKA